MKVNHKSSKVKNSNCLNFTDTSSTSENTSSIVSDSSNTTGDYSDIIQPKALQQWKADETGRQVQLRIVFLFSDQLRWKHKMAFFDWHLSIICLEHFIFWTYSQELLNGLCPDLVQMFYRTGHTSVLTFQSYLKSSMVTQANDWLRYLNFSKTIECLCPNLVHVFCLRFCRSIFAFLIYAKSNMAILAFDWLRNFELCLKNYSVDCVQT